MFVSRFLQYKPVCVDHTPFPHAQTDPQSSVASFYSPFPYCYGRALITLGLVLLFHLCHIFEIQLKISLRLLFFMFLMMDEFIYWQLLDCTIWPPQSSKDRSTNDGLLWSRKRSIYWLNLRVVKTCSPNYLVFLSQLPPSKLSPVYIGALISIVLVDFVFAPHLFLWNAESHPCRTTEFLFVTSLFPWNVLCLQNLPLQQNCKAEG